MKIELQSYDIGCRLSPSISAGTLMQSSYLTYLLFFAVSVDKNKKTGQIKVVDLGVAALKCNDCFVTKCGYPDYGGGDLDTLPEHSLAPFGLTPSSIVKVINSPWSIEVFEQTKKSSSRDSFWNHIYENPQLENLNHFVITFDESTFECIASSLTVEKFCQNFDEAYAYVIAKFGEI